MEEVPGQLGLFASWPRTFARAHGQRIRGRAIPDFPEVQAVLKGMAAERRVGQTWHFHTEEGARLALAARPRMSAWYVPRRSRICGQRPEGEGAWLVAGAGDVLAALERSGRRCLLGDLTDADDLTLTLM
ncbi:hypothetical protein JHN59_21015 [Streptomyces sp. MBT49]|uniref:hypothetical protein n=1 Tax=Streptomyces sp. MBT49 TaxID=1488380 RepID=UPI00190B96E8|nr:hypothetical protein [Streptomyces sp. MBT49]MBK3627282.1 hypothetical protein [Streptomyces sp. MBT49]